MDEIIETISKLKQVSYFRLANYYLLKGLNANTELSSKIQLLLDHHPNIDTSAMGFPEKWKEEPLWKSKD